MDSPILRSFFLARVLMCLIIVFFLLGCSQATFNNQRLTPRLIPTFIPDLSNAPGSNTQASTDIDGLHIQATGLNCFRSSSIYGYSNLVLATGQLQFDANAIQQMFNFFNDPTYSRPLPSALRWIPGGDECFGDYQITNVGGDTVTITRFGIVLTESPISNKYQYHLIDACSFGNLTNGCQQGATASGGCEFDVDIHITGGTGGSKFDAPFTPQSYAGNPCPTTITLNPGDSNEFWASFDNSGNTAQIYNVVPLLIMGSTSIALPKIPSKLAFTTSSQFSCYALQGTIFVQEEISAHCI